MHSHHRARLLVVTLWAATLCAVTLCAASAALAETPTAPPLPALTLDARVSDDLDRIEGRATWRYTHRGPAPLDAVHFELPANRGATPDPHRSQLYNSAGFHNAWAPSSTDIGQVQVAGQPVEPTYIDAPPSTQTHSLERGVLVVPLAAPLAAGETVEIRVDFTTHVPHRQGDEGHFHDTLIWRFGWFPQPRARDADGWTTQAIISAFTHRTTVRGPAEHLVVLGGETAEVAAGKGSAAADGPVRSVPLVVTADARMHSETRGGITRTVLLRPDGALAVDPTERELERTLDVLDRVLTDFAPRYGLPRVRSLHVVELPVPGLSMAADGMLLMSDLFYVYDNTLITDGIYARVFERTLAHEVAHLYFGLGAGVAFDDSNWLSEGMAQLMAQGYAERRFSPGGEDGYDPTLGLMWYRSATVGTLPPENMLRQHTLVRDGRRIDFGLDDPLVAPAEAIEHNEDSYDRLYQSGLVVARTLHTLIGEPATDRLLKTAAERFAGEVLTVDGLVALAAEQGHDLRRWAADFVTGSARVEVSIAGVSTTAEGTTVRIGRSGPPLPVPVAVRYGDDDEVRVVVPADRETVQVARSGEPEAVILDPDGRLPDGQRHDNRWGDRVEWDFLAPRPLTDAHVIGVNVLPLQPYHGLLGASLLGQSAHRWGWFVGAGLVGAESRLVRDEAGAFTGERELQPVFGGTAGLWWRPTRGQRISLFGQVLNGGIQKDDALGVAAQLPWRWAIHEALPSTAPGVTEYPRTVLGLAPYISAWRWTPEPALSGPDDAPLPVDASPEVAPGVRLTILRDARPEWGVTARLTLNGKLNDITEAAPLDDVFAVTLLDLDYATRLPWFGGLRTGVTAFGSWGTGRPYLRRFTVYDINLGLAELTAGGIEAIPTTNPGGPYAHGVTADVRWHIPLVRDARIFNLLTLGVFVFEELGVEFHAAGAWGVPFVEGDPEMLGEVGAALNLGLGVLDGTDNHIAIGAGVPVAGAALYPDGLTWFARVGVDLP